MRQLLLISTAVLVLTVSHAQTITCPTNLDFELGNFYNWTVVPSSDTTIVNGAGIDTCGIFSLVCPNSGQYSARIGDLIGTGLNFSSSITYSMLTDSSSANPTIYYAIVFEDGNHPPSSQAYWECSAKDSSGNVITTLKYTVGNMPPPFQLSSTCTGSPTYFLPWTPLAFNLDGYINQIITINFTVSDCSAGGLHQCYSYIDACDLLLNAVEIKNQTTINIFPNPFCSQTVLQTDNLLHNATLTMDNCFGQTVKQIKNISGQTVTLSRDNLASGLYFVRLTEENKTIAVDKLVITDK